MTDFWKELHLELERINPSSLVAHMDRERPYDGQPHTDLGERGKQLVEGLTMRDIRDCYIRACYDASGLPIEEWPGDIYELPWTDMDPIAIVQQLTCNIEKMMGIFPNVSRLLPKDPTQLHWCGPNLDGAEWTSHEGKCP